MFLSSPALEGRMTPSAGLDRAATYLAAEFKRYGLREGPNKGYFWQFDVSINQKPGKNNMLVLRRDDKTTTFELGREFVPLYGSADNRLTSGELQFVGYGLDEEGWSDYLNRFGEGEEDEKLPPLDVKGKVVLVLSDGPAGRPNPSRAQKAATAKKHGAVGVLFVGPAAPGRAQLPRTVRGQGISTETDIVAVNISEAAINRIVDVSSMRRLAPTKQGMPLPYTARIVTETVPNEARVKNVIGYLDGRDPKLKDEFIVVGAHYDHLGYGEIGSRSQSDAIHLGADDNASGTAGVLALAKYFAATKSNRRTIIFQLYSGEEEGLLGSEAWAKAHPNTVERTAAMLNLDMIGRLRNGELFAYGTSSSEAWDAILAEVKVPGVTLKPGAQTRGDSDQASFARRNVPVLFFNTGLHDEYHTERDSFPTLNIDGMARVVNTVAQTLSAVDRLAVRPAFSKDVVLGNLPGDRSGDRTQRAIRVGLVPDMAADGPGLRINGTSPGSPAEKAGFKAGDRIIEFNGVKVDGLETLQSAYMSAKAGDTVKVVFLRDGVRREQLVTVEER